MTEPAKEHSDDAAAPGMANQSQQLRRRKQNGGRPKRQPLASRHHDKQPNAHQAYRNVSVRVKEWQHAGADHQAKSSRLISSAGSLRFALMPALPDDHKDRQDH